MSEHDIQKLSQDTDGLLTYEYLANNIENIDNTTLETIVENMINIDRTGQFLASAARYLNAVGNEAFVPAVSKLVAATIDRDREHRYLPTLLSSIYGDDYLQRATELNQTDNNFRRIYKRLFPNSII